MVLHLYNTATEHKRTFAIKFVVSQMNNALTSSLELFHIKILVKGVLMERVEMKF